ncbi:hypothetical protein Meth11DRAFT_0182 [Methylophilaceae bacterium 11]|nr:hypothetical protein Meth11DRAFT_0182 [Methylophilaceae bacterium 11]
MQLRVISAAVIYIGSYLPLSVILLCQNFDKDIYNLGFCNPWIIFATECKLPLKNPIFATSFLIACTFCFFIAIFTLYKVDPKKNINIIESKPVPADLMNYVLPYIVSFMSLDYQDTSKFVGFTIFILWIFWITYKSGLIILNPLFVAFGWRLYEIKYSFAGSGDEFYATALSKIELSPKQNCAQETIQDVLIIKK